MMFNRTIFAVVAALAGIVSSAAVPDRLVARSSAHAIAETTGATLLPAPAAGGSTAPPPSTAPSSSLSSSPTSPPAPPAPTPTPVWNVTVEVGSTAFAIGDADESTFEGLWKSVCSANGCDAGSPVDFSFAILGPELGSTYPITQTGAFTLSGAIDNNDAITNDLLDSINAALKGSMHCTTGHYQDCGPAKRDSLLPKECDEETINRCTMANYIQATIWDDTKAQMGQVTMSATSVQSSFGCGDMLGAMGAAATALDLEPPVQGAIALASVVCGLVSGS